MQVRNAIGMTMLAIATVGTVFEGRRTRRLSRSEDFAQHVAREYPMWIKLVKDSGAQVH